MMKKVRVNMSNNTNIISQQIRAEGAAMSLGHNEQIQHEIEKRLAIIETLMDEIRQILANNQRVLPAPRTRPSQTVSLFRATGRRSRARQADHNSAITKSFPKGQTKNEFNHWTCLSRDVASVWRSKIRYYLAEGAGFFAVEIQKRFSTSFSTYST